MKGRFAPSPTGRMHLGNIFTALLSWLSTRSQGGTWLLRHEDLDPQRSRREYAKLIEDDLQWLGLDWDEGGLEQPETLQSNRDELYNHTLEALCKTGMVYPCYCTRSEIMATQAPHQTDGRIVYGGSCRPEIIPDYSNTPDALMTDNTTHWRSLRLAVPDREIPFNDLVCGACSFNLVKECGDFIMKRADGAWAYQLAVVTDDALMGVTEVVRANDLLLSTSQQLYLYELMGWNPPLFAHTPLLINKQGQRLSKRDASLSMEKLRKSHTPAELIGLLAYHTGLIATFSPINTNELLQIFTTLNFTSQTITIPIEQFV